MPPHRYLALGLVLALPACGDSNGPAPGPTTALRLQPVDSGFNFSLFVTAPPGDPSRLLIVERGGRILLRKNGVRQDSAFLNLTSLINPSASEYGAYSMAFHPQYATNRRFFVYYNGVTRAAQLAEFQADPSFDHADLATRIPILTQPEGPNAVLYGGLTAFGSDGMLYLSVGDGQPGGFPLSQTQDSGSWIGKMLRIDVDHGAPYTIPSDNPYVNRPGWLKEIWQLGLRNPWRWSFDRASGDFYLGDVGENTWEEVDYLPAPVVGGNNFGWPFVEGPACFQPATGCATAGLVPPVFFYPHQPACAIAGGYVYRGAALPSVQGTYFYGDYCGGWVRSLRIVNGGPIAAYDGIASPLINDNVVSFGEDAAGEIYVVMASGRVYRIAGAS